MMTVWNLACNNCDRRWTIEVLELEHPDDVSAACPDCGSDDYEAELPRMLP